MITVHVAVRWSAGLSGSAYITHSQDGIRSRLFSKIKGYEFFFLISDDLFIWAEVFVLAKFRRYNIHGIRVRQLHSYVWYYVIICYVINNDRHNNDRRKDQCIN